jgi:hypothetical protein
VDLDSAWTDLEADVSHYECTPWTDSAAAWNVLYGITIVTPIEAKCPPLRAHFELAHGLTTTNLEVHVILTPCRWSGRKSCHETRNDGKAIVELAETLTGG